MSNDAERWTIGDITVTLIRELLVPVDPVGMFDGVDASAVIEAEAGWLKPHFVDDDGMLPLSIHCLVVEVGGDTIVVDTCLGDRELPGFEAMSNMGPKFLADFAAAGFDREQVTHVVCTHLHFDHVGWNTMLVDGAWVPTFPNARYVFGRTEYEYWDGGALGAAITFDSAVKPVVDAGLAELVDVPHRVNDCVRLEPTPGHSPGHVTVMLDSNGERAAITGDMLHHPIQFSDGGIDWPNAADDDRAVAARTRRAFRDDVADQPILVIGTHFAPPTAGWVRRGPNGHRFEV